MSYVWTPSIFLNSFFFVCLFVFLLQFWSFMVEIRLGQGLKVSWVSTATVCHFFSIYVVSGPLPGITGWGVSILSRSHRAAGVGDWQEEEEGVLPYRPSHTNVPRPQNKGVLCQEQVSPSACSQLGHLMTQKWGGSFRQVLEFSFASFLIVGIPP